MNYYLHKSGVGMLLTDWIPFSTTLPLHFDAAPDESVVRIVNNGRAYYYPLNDGKCLITEKLEGECRITVESRKSKAMWQCESIYVDEKDGVKIAHGFNLRNTVTEIRKQLCSLKDEFTQIKINMSDLTKKVDYTLDGHDFV